MSADPLSPAHPNFVGPLTPAAAAAKELDRDRKMQIRTLKGKLTVTDRLVTNSLSKYKETEAYIGKLTAKIETFTSDLNKLKTQLYLEKERIEEQNETLRGAKIDARRHQEMIDDIRGKRERDLRMHDLPPPSPEKKRHRPDIPRPLIV